MSALHPQSRHRHAVPACPLRAHFQTHTPQRAKGLVNHLIGAGEQHRRHVKAQRLGGLEIDDQLEFGWLLDGKVGRFGAIENLVRVGRYPRELSARQRLET